MPPKSPLQGLSLVVTLFRPPPPPLPASNHPHTHISEQLRVSLEDISLRISQSVLLLSDLVSSFLDWGGQDFIRLKDDIWSRTKEYVLLCGSASVPLPKVLEKGGWPCCDVEEKRI